MTKKITKKNNVPVIAGNKRIDALYGRIVPVIREARATVMRAIDTVMVSAYWNMGDKLWKRNSKELHEQTMEKKCYLDYQKT